MDTKDAIHRLGALAQESRLAIFRLLVEHGPAGLTVGRIAERLELAPATLSFHLKELAASGLIEGRQEGRFIHYSANFEVMSELVSYLTMNCCRESGDTNCITDRTPKSETKPRRKQAA